MIETKNLTKTFDSFTAVDSLDLRIETGEFFGLLGPNGAGKTTTISLLSTLLLPTAGEILINGQTLGRNRPDLKRKISVITQEYSMRQDMNMDEIMEYQGRLYFMPRKEIKEKTEELLDFCGLLPFRKRTVRKLSGGMKRKLFSQVPKFFFWMNLLQEWMRSPGGRCGIFSVSSTEKILPFF